MELKQFLETQNMSHLLKGLEEHFDIKPKSMTINEAARKIYGKNARAGIFSYKSPDGNTFFKSVIMEFGESGATYYNSNFREDHKWVLDLLVLHLKSKGVCLYNPSDYKSILDLVKG